MGAVPLIKGELLCEELRKAVLMPTISTTSWRCAKTFENVTIKTNKRNSFFILINYRLLNYMCNNSYPAKVLVQRVKKMLVIAIVNYVHQKFIMNIVCAVKGINSNLFVYKIDNIVIRYIIHTFEMPERTFFKPEFGAWAAGQVNTCNQHIFNHIGLHAQ